MNALASALYRFLLPKPPPIPKALKDAEIYRYHWVGYNKDTVGKPGLLLELNTQAFSDFDNCYQAAVERFNCGLHTPDCFTTALVVDTRPVSELPESQDDKIYEFFFAAIPIKNPDFPIPQAHQVGYILHSPTCPNKQRYTNKTDCNNAAIHWWLDSQMSIPRKFNVELFIGTTLGRPILGKRFR